MVNWPLYFFCTECGAIHELTYRDLHDETWAKVMQYIADNFSGKTRLILPGSEEIAEHFGFTRRQAQYYLKEYRELTYNLVKSCLSKGERIK